MNPTNDELRNEIFEYYDVPESWREETQLGTNTLTKVCEDLGIWKIYGSGRAKRRRIRAELRRRRSGRELVDHSGLSSWPLRNQELREIVQILRDRPGPEGESAEVSDA